MRQRRRANPVGPAFKAPAMRAPSRSPCETRIRTPSIPYGIHERVFAETTQTGIAADWHRSASPLRHRRADGRLQKKPEASRGVLGGFAPPPAPLTAEKYTMT